MGDSEQNKLFVGGISRETSEETLRDHFCKYGVVVESVVARDRNTGSPRGFGFVSFSDQSAVDKALHDTHVILERTVEVKKAIPRSEHHQNQHQQNEGLSRNGRSNSRSADQSRTKKIFVGGLAPNLTDEEFKIYFEKFGRITDVVVMQDNVTGRPRGFGFITFDSEDAVEDAVQNSFQELGGKLVEVKKAIPKEGNNTSNNFYNAGVGSGREISNNYQFGNYLPYFPRYWILPDYGYLSLCGGPAGYPYGSGPFTGGSPTGGFSGIDYRVIPMVLRNPWNGPAVQGIRGGLLPYANVGTFYPSYSTGGVGVMATNRYNAIAGIGTNGKLGQLGSSDAQVAADATPSRINGGNMNVNSLTMVESCGATSGRQ